MAKFALHSGSGLKIRFMVQFNLFAGTIAARGGPEQVRRLDKMQTAGKFGFFASTVRSYHPRPTRKFSVDGLKKSTVPYCTNISLELGLFSPSDGEAATRRVFHPQDACIKDDHCGGPEMCSPPLQFSPKEGHVRDRR